MILISTIILAVLAAVMLAWIIFIYFFTHQLVANFFKGEAPFIPSKEKYLPEIAGAMELSEDSVVCDLGCGDARVLIACCKMQPEAKYIGFDKNITPYLWARLRVSILGLSKKIKIYKSDFFEADLSATTHIFLYLVPRQIERLKPVIEKEIINGKRIVSLKFSIPGFAPREVLPLGNEKLFIY